MQKHFSGHHSTPYLGNRRRDCDHISHVVRYWIGVANLRCQPWNCGDAIDLLCCRFSFLSVTDTHAAVVPNKLIGFADIDLRVIAVAPCDEALCWYSVIINSLQVKAACFSLRVTLFNRTCRQSGDNLIWIGKDIDVNGNLTGAQRRSYSTDKVMTWWGAVRCLLMQFSPTASNLTSLPCIWRVCVVRLKIRNLTDWFNSFWNVYFLKVWLTTNACVLLRVYSLVV